jgi:hypothetical protein
LDHFVELGLLILLQLLLQVLCEQLVDQLLRLLFLSDHRNGFGWLLAVVFSQRRAFFILFFCLFF